MDQGGANKDRQSHGYNREQDTRCDRYGQWTYEISPPEKYGEKPCDSDNLPKEQDKDKTHKSSEQDECDQTDRNEKEYSQTYSRCNCFLSIERFQTGPPLKNIF